MVARGEIGIVKFYTDSKLTEKSSLAIWSKFFNRNLDIGPITANDGVILYLPEGGYWFSLRAKGRSVAFDFKVEGGKEKIYKWDRVGDQPYEVSELPSINLIFNGAVLADSQMAFQRREMNTPKINLIQKILTDSSVSIGIDIPNRELVSSLSINGKDRSKLLREKNIVATEDLVVGKNLFVVKAVSLAGFEYSKQLVFDVRSSAEKEEEANRARMERERLNREALEKKAEEERIAREGDGSPEDLLCKRYGLKPQTSGYGECRMRLDFAKAESQRQQAQYEREQAEYQRQMAALERERERRRAAALVEIGARMMGGQSPINALGSLGTGAPIAPTRPAPIDQTITLPGGRMINCTTMGTMTNCF